MKAQLVHAAARKHVEGKLASPEIFDLRHLLNDLVFHFAVHGVGV